MEQTTEHPPSLFLKRLPAALWCGSSLAVVVPWLLAACDRGLPLTLAQAVVGLGLLSLAGLLVRTAAMALLNEVRASPWVGWGLAVLFVASTAIHFHGLAFEVGRGYYGDEGIYRAIAEDVNRGALLPRSFIYGHLSYYLAALVLWLRGLFPGPSGWLAMMFAGVTDEGQVNSLWLRAISGACGALTVLPVFGIARRISGNTGGFLGGWLIACAPLYNQIAHLFISDVPAAFFATLCLWFVAQLLERETTWHYALAGIMAGLAAGTKYPAGVVAVAILGVWIWWRLQTRQWGGGLWVAAAAALLTFLGVMPALMVHAADAFAGHGRDLFFGVRQYGGHGWIGVVQSSNAGWYGRQIWETFGAGALCLGFAGLPALGREAHRRLLVMAVFPLVYGALLCAMGMVVKRNLQPLLPITAALLGAGAAGLVSLVERRRQAWRKPALVAVAVGMLAQPAASAIQQTVGMTRPGTREMAVAWIRENVPRGAALVKEAYTPRLAPDEYTWTQSRFAARLDPDEVRSGRYDFVLLADSAYARFLNPDNLRKEHQKVYAARYRQLLDLPVVQSFESDERSRGPGLLLLRIDPPAIVYVSAREFGAADVAFVPNQAMHPRPEGAVVFAARGEYALFKDYFQAGRYRLVIDSESVEGGSLRVVSRENRLRAAVPIRGGAAEFELPAREKVFLYLELPPGSSLRGLKVIRLTAPAH